MSASKPEPWVPKVGMRLRRLGTHTASPHAGKYCAVTRVTEDQFFVLFDGMSHECATNYFIDMAADLFEEIAAAQPEIEVGDTVLWKYGSMTEYRFVVQAMITSYGTPCVRDDLGGIRELRNCRLISKGKKGQGANAGKELADGSRQGSAGAPDRNLAPSAERFDSSPPPCPACRGSVHGPGKISDWNDNPIACPKCQYGKPAKEPEPVRPYHKMLPSGECVLVALEKRDECFGQTQADTSAINDALEARLERNAAIGALARARAEAKRLGIES